MKPVSPVIPGENVPEVTYAEDQPEYNPLPAIRGDEGTVLTRWKCNWRDRFRVLFIGNVYVWVMTFNEPLQPLQLDTKKPNYNTVFAFKDRFKDWIRRSFNFNRKYGWMKTPGGWLCWDFEGTLEGSPRIYWSKDQTLTDARVILR